MAPHAPGFPQPAWVGGRVSPYMGEAACFQVRNPQVRTGVQSPRVSACLRQAWSREGSCRGRGAPPGQSSLPVLLCRVPAGDGGGFSEALCPAAFFPWWGGGCFFGAGLAVLSDSPVPSPTSRGLAHSPPDAGEARCCCFVSADLVSVVTPWQAVFAFTLAGDAKLPSKLSLLKLIRIVDLKKSVK